MNLASIVLLLQMVLALLSQPNMAQNTQVQSLANQAMSAATQALAQATTNVVSTPATVSTPETTPPAPIVSSPTPGIVYNGVSYPSTQANLNVFSEIQQTESNCKQQMNSISAQLAAIQQSEVQSIRALNGNGVPQSIVNNEEQAITQSSTLALAANSAQEESTQQNCQENIEQLQQQLQISQ